MSAGPPLRVDGHQHFFDPARHAYPWSGDGGVLDRPYGPDALVALLDSAHIGRTVLVQALPSEDETCDLLSLASSIDRVGAVTGWLDLCAVDVSDRIAHLRAGAGGARLRGIRHQVCDEPDDAWLLRPEVQRGIAAVGDAGLVYELLVRPAQHDAALRTVRAHPGQRFVLGHLGLPPVHGDDGEVAAWRQGVRGLAEHDNVACKLAGLLTLAGTSWNPALLRHFVDAALDSFGPQRLLFGSDWPACLLGGSYAEAVAVVEDAVASLSREERDAVMGGTAASLYGIS